MRRRRPTRATRPRRVVDMAQVRIREAGTAHRLRVPLASRDRRAGEGAGAGVLRQAGRTRVLRRLFVGRLRGPDGGAALPCRLRRHRRRRAGEQLDAADGGRSRRRPRGAQDPASNLPPAALGLLHRGALAACDAHDGVADGVLDDPRRCKFDPATLSCRRDQPSATCLTPAQVDAARRVYGGLKDPRTGAQLYPGLAPGSEPFWPHRDPANPFPIPLSHYKWLVFGDPNWDWKTFDFADPDDYQAHLKAEAKFAPIMNATNPDLRAFRQRGGKLLQYHGWNDQLIAPQNSIDYYESVQAFFGPRRRTCTELLSAVHGARHGALQRRHRAEHVRHAGRARSSGSSAASRPTRSSRRARSTASRSAASAVRVSENRRVRGQG